MFNNMLPVGGRYTMFLDLPIVSATSLAASILLSSTNPGPALAVASEMSLAASDSPSALVTAAIRSYFQSMESGEGIARYLISSEDNEFHPLCLLFCHLLGLDRFGELNVSLG